ncbi:MAG TPA: ribonucleotide-diphosphate reductase subunit beta [Candidatus Absconditabacterales bacterium]|nr:ribonucleotide-diphosphate reductase subunit beta [Candidatus Absconditabacterales bacterium]
MPILGKKSVLDGIKLDGKDNVFADLYKKQKQAVWFPEEINIQQDVGDYNDMSPREKALFQELIGYFVTTELLVQNVLGESFYPYIVNPKAKMAMTIQMFMEDIHSDFFEMVLNTFSMDREAMYEKTKTNPALKAKQEFVAKAADFISVSNRENTIDPDTIEGKKAILHAILINNIIQEGTFFYSAFALFFAMRESGKMKNVTNGIDLIMIDESLHLKLGVEMILGVIEENPIILEDAEFVNHIKNTMIDGTELELQFIKQQFDQNIIFGLSYNEMEEYIKYITDRRLEELGFTAHYAVQVNPLKFLQKQDLMTLQNFFEVTPNQYTNF